MGRHSNSRRWTIRKAKEPMISMLSRHRKLIKGLWNRISLRWECRIGRERRRRGNVVAHCIWNWCCNQIESICRAVRGREEGRKRREGMGGIERGNVSKMRIVILSVFVVL